MKLNLGRLQSIETTLKAIADIENAMAWYEDTSKTGPAYMKVKNPVSNMMDHALEIQIDRQDFLDLMELRKEQLIRNLEERFDGFEYDPDAYWAGDNRGEE